MGKPLPEAIGEVKKAASGARHFAEAGEGYLAPQAIPGTPAHIIHESVGPIFGVMPWNLPFWQVLRFFIPAALVGNTVIVKHAETVQGSAEALEVLVRDAGGPEGLYVNLAIERDKAAAVIADPRIRAVTVTGSVAAGRAVAAEAGRHGKKVVLELGGSDPFIVLEDADLAQAVKLGVVSRYSNNAQSCIAAKRFLVAESLVEAFTKAFVEQAAALPMGDPAKDGIKLGPLARSDLRDNVHRQVRDAVKAGARVLTGGEIPAGPGNFYPPTVLVGLPPDAAIAQEEFFGPRRDDFPVQDRGRRDPPRQRHRIRPGRGGLEPRPGPRPPCRRPDRSGRHLHQRFHSFRPPGTIRRRQRFGLWSGAGGFGGAGADERKTRLGRRITHPQPLPCREGQKKRLLPSLPGRGRGWVARRPQGWVAHRPPGAARPPQPMQHAHRNPHAPRDLPQSALAFAPTLRLG